MMHQNTICPAAGSAGLRRAFRAGIFLFAAGVLAAAGGGSAGRVRVLRHQDAPESLQFGVRELEAALAAIEAQPGARRSPATITVETLDQPPLDSRRVRTEAGVPTAAESFAIRRQGDRILVLGRDAVGAMYGALEVAETLRRSRSLAAVTAMEQEPFLRFRAVNQFLFEDALEDASSWFHQEEFWEGYFAMLARTRHNVLDVHAGYSLVRTHFPNIYPYFVHLEEYPAQSVGRAVTERNLATLNRIIAIGRSHGVHVALMNYTVQGRVGLENSELLAGMDGDALAEYTYLASRELLRACPDLWMYGFRIGESGQPEDFFEKTYLAAIRDSNYQGKVFTRSWLAFQENIEAITDSFSGDFYIEVKYNGERLGLPYLAITSPTQFDSSYSYEAYTNLPRNFELVYQVRANGTHRIFHWGDPAYVSRVVKTSRMGDAAGYSIEPMTAYYPMEDRYHPEDGHQYFTRAWERDWFWYELWGRLAYNPDLSPDTFTAMFEQRFGTAGESLYHLLVTASEVVPLIDSAIALGPDHRQWAPEFETGNPNFSNVDGLRSYGNIGGALDVSSLDPTVMSSFAEAAAQEIAGESDGRLSPRATAERLFVLAGRIDELLAAVPAAASNGEEAECIRLDAEALASLARFTGERYLAALNLAKYRITSYPRCLVSARHHLLWAREHWRRLSIVADGHYAPLLESLRMQSQAYRWESQLAIIDGDLSYIASLEQPWDLQEPSDGIPRLSHLPGGRGRSDWFPSESAAWPVQWRNSAFDQVTVDGRPALRSRGGRLAFDVDELLLFNVDADITIDLPYWDSGDGPERRILVEYDGAARPIGSLVQAGTIQLGGPSTGGTAVPYRPAGRGIAPVSGEREGKTKEAGWRRAQFVLERARLADAGPGNSDIVLSSPAGGELVVQTPSIHLRQAIPDHLDLHIARTLERPATQATIHWRPPGRPWRTDPLIPALGDRDMNAHPRGREYYRFEVPDGLEAIEYYFTAEWQDDRRRLPAGNEVYQWRRPAETAAPTFVSEPPGQRGKREGSIEIRARVTDPSGVSRVLLHYKPIPSQKEWQSVEMNQGADGRYAATVPLTSEGLLYRFAAWDTLGNAARYPDFRVETPYHVIESWDATIAGEP